MGVHITPPVNTMDWSRAVAEMRAVAAITVVTCCFFDNPQSQTGWLKLQEWTLTEDEKTGMDIARVDNDGCSLIARVDNVGVDNDGVIDSGFKL